MSIKFFQHKTDNYHRVDTVELCEVPTNISQAIFLDDDNNFTTHDTIMGPVHSIGYGQGDLILLLSYLTQGLIDVAEINKSRLDVLASEDHTEQDARNIAITHRASNAYAQQLQTVISKVTEVLADPTSTLELVFSNDFWIAEHEPV